MVSKLCLMCGSTLNCQTLCLGARPRYSLVVDEDVKKPTNQPTTPAAVVGVIPVVVVAVVNTDVVIVTHADETVSGFISKNFLRNEELIYRKK